MKIYTIELVLGNTTEKIGWGEKNHTNQGFCTQTVAQVAYVLSFKPKVEI